ncbi:tyrosine-type recombinase/integrase [Lacticaseibacillus nasuensis]|uniref:Integrase n=1 Tax=Lacticaseibacillus nasuensis JCM 17158 TaxID=1291734 RepID=A0A0R1JKG9_9LACO|nr:tyrosine-type recombinase/integrase [Lacticaseibacillus nasuensis]KRK71877.1 integrase [Lacticaseibacillus nasuensis JCM 17158]
MRDWKPVPKHPNIFMYDTKRGKRYGVRRGFKNGVGKRDEFTKSGFATWREAEASLRQFESQVALGKFDELASGRITMEQAWNHYVKTKDDLGTWRVTTRESQMNWWNLYIKEPLGSMRLKDIRQPQMRSFLNSLATDKNLAHATIGTIFGTINSVLNQAVMDDLLDKNRVRKVQYAGKAAKKKMESPANTQKWLDTAHQVLSAYDYTMVLVMAQTGLRSGEVTGLRTSSIEFKRDEIHKTDYATITIDMQRSVHYPTGAPLKTRTSYRTIAVTGELVGLLKQAVTSAETRRKRAHPHGFDGTPWLWLTRTGETCSPTHLRYLCLLVSKECGIKIHPHMFRHYFATQAIASEKPEIDVMHYLGHASVQMTADYTRSTEHASLEVAKGFEAVTKRVAPAGGTKNDVPPDVPSNGSN